MLCYFKEERLQILKVLSRHMTLDSDVNLKHFADTCQHFTGADYKGKVTSVNKLTVIINEV